MFSRRLCCSSSSARQLSTTASSFSSTSSSPLLFSQLKFCSSSSSATADDPIMKTGKNKSSSSASSFFFPVRSLRKLGEQPDLVRRALTTQNEQKLTKTANAFISAHRRRIVLIKEMRNIKKFRLLKRFIVKNKLRVTNMNLYLQRCKVRGWGVLADLLVLGVLVSFVAFSYSVFYALYVYMKRQERLQEMTAHITHTVEMLEEHGNDGEKLVNSRVAKGETLPMPEDEKDWHLYDTSKKM